MNSSILTPRNNLKSLISKKWRKLIKKNLNLFKIKQLSMRRNYPKGISFGIIQITSKQ